MPRHASGAFGDDRIDLVDAAASGDADERGKLRRLAAKIRPMARRTVAVVERLAGGRLTGGQVAFDEFDAPRHLVCVDKEAP